MVLERLKSGEVAQTVMLDVAISMWSCSSTHVQIVIKKLLRLKIVTAASVLKWIFHQQQHFHRTWLWDLLFNHSRHIINMMDSTLATLEQRIKALTVIDDETKLGQSRNSLEKLQGQKKELFLRVIESFNSVIQSLEAGSEEKRALAPLVADRLKQFLRTVACCRNFVAPLFNLSRSALTQGRTTLYKRNVGL